MAAVYLMIGFLAAVAWWAWVGTVALDLSFIIVMIAAYVLLQVNRAVFLA